VIKDFCYPDPKHPGHWICPEKHTGAPHRKIKPENYPNIMEQLAEVWDEGRAAGYNDAMDEIGCTFSDDTLNPYRMFTPDEK